MRRTCPVGADWQVVSVRDKIAAQRVQQRNVDKVVWDDRDLIHPLACLHHRHSLCLVHHRRPLLLRDRGVCVHAGHQ